MAEISEKELEKASGGNVIKDAQERIAFAWKARTCSKFRAKEEVSHKPCDKCIHFADGSCREHP